ncbi:SPASM domain-containing protein [Thermococcus peptonophilus]|uniref:SPASM domain-containing protein n=1 Tax=Thermococcus peptonophilus TaxID=53952 RepID=UPI003467D8AF
MLPDGRVTVCERLANLDWLIVGDLKKESVRDVWESERVRWFRNLPRELYRGTPCYSCQYFETICQPRGGICLLSSYALNGRFFGPDSMCPFVRRGGRKNESKG